MSRVSEYSIENIGTVPGFSLVVHPLCPAPAWSPSKGATERSNSSRPLSVVVAA